MPQNPTDKDQWEPHDAEPWIRAWRRRRAAKGKGDNWLTRPLIRLNGRRKAVEFLPKDDLPPDGDG